MSKLHIKTGDTVVLLTGDAKDRKKSGKVLQVSPKEGKVIVEGLNKVKKHVKPKKAGDPSGIIETESAIYACKVQLVCPKCGKATRVGTKIYEDGKKDRVCKKCGETF
ncbi:MAG: 50S ribosomal protein L24 [Clostridia bacterium]|nr:50S ribosomal protein L24 [Clostridia bacterium]